MVACECDLDAPGVPDIPARCAAANYALAQGLGFLRHVRARIGTEPGGIVKADAVYTMSAALPDGVRPPDVEVIAADCAGQGMPVV